MDFEIGIPAPILWPARYWPGGVCKRGACVRTVQDGWCLRFCEAGVQTARRHDTQYPSPVAQNFLRCLLSQPPELLYLLFPVLAVETSCATGKTGGVIKTPEVDTEASRV